MFNFNEFVKAYEKIQPEMNVIRAIVDARTSQIEDVKEERIKKRYEECKGSNQSADRSGCT